MNMKFYANELHGIRHWVIYAQFTSNGKAHAMMEVFRYMGVNTEGKHVFQAVRDKELLVTRSEDTLYTEMMRPFSLDTKKLGFLAETLKEVI